MNKPALLKEMRDRTGLHLLACRMALEKADWDIEKAIQLSKNELKKIRLINVRTGEPIKGFIEPGK